jgi:hypothetical protein
MGGQIFCLHILDQTKNHSDDTDKKPDVKNSNTFQGAAEKGNIGQIRQFNIRFTRESGTGKQKKYDAA